MFSIWIHKDGSAFIVIPCSQDSCFPTSSSEVLNSRFEEKKDIQEENSLKLVSLTKEVLQLYEKTETMQRQILKMKERQQKSLDSLGTKIKSMSYLEGNNEEILRAEAKKAEDIHEMAAHA